jgi:hypothetical protein
VSPEHPSILTSGIPPVSLTFQTASLLGEENAVSENDPRSAGPRPDGVPGLLIDEIDLQGISRTSKGYVAQVPRRDPPRSYLLKQGDRLFDGDVVVIQAKEVVFKQLVPDPGASRPFREVVKTLPGA